MEDKYNLEMLSKSAEKIACELSYGDINSALSQMKELSIKAKISESERDKCSEVISLLYAMNKDPNFISHIQNKYK